MNYRILFLMLASFAISSLTAMTVKVQDWEVEEFAQDLFDAQDIYLVAVDIRDQINNDFGFFDFAQVEDRLNEFGLAALVDMNGNVIFLNRESYDQVINFMDLMVPEILDFDGNAIKVYANLALAALEDRVINALGAVQWRENLGQLINAQLNPDGANIPGDVFMSKDDFIALWMNRNN